MRILLLVAIMASPAWAQVTEIDVRHVTGSVVALDVSLTGSSDDARAIYSGDSSFPVAFYATQSNNNTSAPLVVTGGGGPGDTVYVRVQERTGGSFTNVDCNSVTLSLAPELGGPTPTCHASGYLVVTLDASDTSIAPAAPGGLPDLDLPALGSGTTSTASSCADLQTKLTTALGLTGDGNADSVEIACGTEWRDCSTISAASKTNTDDVVITVPAACREDSRCPGPGERMTWEEAATCTALLSKAGQGTLFDIQVPKVHLNRLYITTPPVGHSAYTEGGTISSCTPNGDDLDCTVTGHGLSTTPDLAVVRGCAESGAASAEGVYHTTDVGYSKPDANTVRLIDAGTKDCTGGSIYQDPAGTTSYDGGLIRFRAAAANSSLSQSIIHIGYPARYQWLIDQSSDGFTFANNTTHSGNWVAYNASNQYQRGSLFTEHQLSGTGITLDNVSNFRGANNVHTHAGVGFYFGDQFSDTGFDHSFRRIIHTWPSALVAETNQDLGYVSRGHLIENKSAAEVEAVGLLQMEIPVGPGNSNTTPDIVAIRNIGYSTDGSHGSSDWRMESLTGYRTPMIAYIEGQTFLSPRLGRQGGNYLLTNVLHNRPEAIEALDQSGHYAAGSLFTLTGQLSDVRLENFVKYKPADEGPIFHSISGQFSRLEVQNGVILGETRHVWGSVFMRLENGPNQSPAIAVGAKGANAFAWSARILGADSYVDNLAVVCGRENPGSDYSVTTDGARVTASECAAEWDASDYTFTNVTDYTSAAGTSIQADIDSVGCSDDFDCGEHEGVDIDKMRADVGLFGKCAGKSSIGAPERISDSTIRYCFRAPDTTSACTFEYRVADSTGAHTTVAMATGSRDRTADLAGVAETRYEWTVKCAGSPDELRGRGRPGSAP